MSKNRSSEKEEFWRMVLQEHSSSGVTIKAFCEQQGISLPLFYVWRRKIKERGQHAGSAHVAQDPVTRLIPVSVIPDVHDRQACTAIAASIDVEIISPSGFTLRVDSSMSPARITDLLGAITACRATGVSPC